MRRLLLPLLFSLLAVPTAACAEASLFFTESERQIIEKEVRDNAQTGAQARHLLHLSSIIYFAPDRWSLWLQGRRFAPDTQDGRVRILQVSPEAASLEASMANGEKRTVTLRPHQSLNLLSGEIIEGY